MSAPGPGTNAARRSDRAAAAQGAAQKASDDASARPYRGRRARDRSGRRRHVCGARRGRGGGGPDRPRRPQHGRPRGRHGDGADDRRRRPRRGRARQRRGPPGGHAGGRARLVRSGARRTPVRGGAGANSGDGLLEGRLGARGRAHRSSDRPRPPAPALLLCGHPQHRPRRRRHPPPPCGARGRDQARLRPRRDRPGDGRRAARGRRGLRHGDGPRRHAGGTGDGGRDRRADGALRAPARRPTWRARAMPSRSPQVLR